MNRDAATLAFSALSNATRIEVFRLLVSSGPQGMQAGDIGRVLAMRQNTMSMNLRVLTEAGLVTSQREGRAVRYFANFDGVGRLLSYLLEDCCGGDKSACTPLIDRLTANMKGRIAMRDTPFNVLFLCTGNSARSIMAEAILNRAGAGRFRTFSAGSHPAGQVNPYALKLLENLNFETSALRSKNWDEFAAPDAPKMDFVFTVCDQAAAEVCPIWPGQPINAHWGVPDPAKAEGSPAEVALAFADVFRMLETRINAFTALPVASLDRLTLKDRVADIGKLSNR